MNNTQPKYYYTDKIPESWKPSRYGMTCAPLTADIGKVPRVCTGKKHRAARIKALGNGQVPQAMVLAWGILSEDLE